VKECGNDGLDFSDGTIEVKHQIKVSEAKILLSDGERLPLVLGVAKDLGIPQSKVFLLSKDQAAADKYGVLCLNQLFNVGEWQWDRFNDLERAKRLVSLSHLSPLKSMKW
jgi:hypothetical protein